MQNYIVLPTNFLTYGKLGVALSKVENSNSYINIFIRLLFLAAQNEGVVQVSPNEAYYNEDLANLCGCSEQELTDAIYLFEDTNLIFCENGIIHIVGWLDYCDKPTQRVIKARENARENKLNYIRDGCQDTPLEIKDFFESIWELYPKKLGKGSVSLTQKKKLFNIGYEQIVRCVERYADEIRINNTPSKYMVNGSTFFNSRYVDYLDENYKGTILINDGKKLSPMEQLKLQMKRGNDE